jgi:hypothetical protein
MVVSSTLDGDVVQPIFASDNQREEIELGRQLQVHISDAASATATVLPFESVKDAKALGLLSEQESPHSPPRQVRENFRIRC